MVGAALGILVGAAIAVSPHTCPIKDKVPQCGNAGASLGHYVGSKIYG